MLLRVPRTHSARRIASALRGTTPLGQTSSPAAPVFGPPRPQSLSHSPTPSRAHRFEPCTAAAYAVSARTDVKTGQRFQQASLWGLFGSGSASTSSQAADGASVSTTSVDTSVSTTAVAATDAAVGAPISAPADAVSVAEIAASSVTETASVASSAAAAELGFGEFPGSAALDAAGDSLLFVLSSPLPVRSAMSALETLHTASHLPWTLTLILAAAVCRLILAPIAWQQLKAATRVARARGPLARVRGTHSALKSLPPGSETIPRPSAMGAASAALRLMRVTARQHGLSLLKLLAPPLVAAPVFITFNQACRGLLGRARAAAAGAADAGAADSASVASCATDVASASASASDFDLLSTLTTQGPWWSPDLTAPDETLALPIIALAATLVNLNVALHRFAPAPGAAEGSPEALAAAGQPPVLLRRIGTGLQAGAALATPLLLHLPSALFLYWITSMTLSAAQGLVLKLPTVRAAAGFALPPMPASPCKLPPLETGGGPAPPETGMAGAGLRLASPAPSGGNGALPEPGRLRRLPTLPVEALKLAQETADKERRLRGAV